MTAKLDLNNELIVMKKTIQQAKVCVIQKLIRKLKNIKDNEKEKNALKLSGKKIKLTDQINYLKKIPNLELATLALTFNKNPTKILTNHSSSIEDTSLALIVTFEPIRTKIKEIKTKFGLTDDVENWRDNLLEIGKKKKRKIEKEKFSKRNKERKENHKKIKEIAKKREEWLVENIESSEQIVGVGDKIKVDKSDNSQLDESDNSQSDDSDNSQVDESDNSQVDESDNSDVDESDNSEVDKNEKSLEKPPEKSKEMFTEKSKEISTEESNKMGKGKKRNSTHHSNLGDPINTIGVPLHKKKKSEPIKTVDPFFITGSGAKYLATAVVERIQPKGPNDGLDRKERRAQQFGKKPKTISKRQDKQFNTSVTSKSTPRFQVNNSKTKTDLHPSWAAKMKNKGIDKFQGKKIKFGDDVQPGFVSKKSFPEPVPQPLTQLHPSWVAKQKFKPVISEFKGNKIVFTE